MIDFADNSGSSDHDVDAILAEVYGGGEKPAQQDSQATSPPPAPEPREFEFNHRGQAIKIKENDPRMTQWMQQGYDYAQNISAFKGERDTWEKQRQDWEKQWNPYKEVDSFARDNPDWWNHVEQSYQSRLSTPVEIPEPVKQYLEPIIKDYSLVKGFVQDYQKQQIEKQQQEEDAKLEEAIKSIQGKYKDLDFSAQDESGLSLEQRVLNHAMQNQFPTFRAAFLDYYHDNLEKLAEARGKEMTMKEIEKRKKLGLLDEKPTLGKPSPSSFFSKPKSWNDPALSGEAILKEFNFG
jgi:hypothetical protein